MDGSVIQFVLSLGSSSEPEQSDADKFRGSAIKQKFAEGPSPFVLEAMTPHLCFTDL